MIHSFQTDDAVRYGLVEAVMLNNFRFWIANNKANSKHQHDDRTWTYNSVKAFVELFPYLTVNQIRRCLESLVDQGVLVRGNYNASPYDKTTWFAFTSESFCLTDVANLPNGNGVSAKSDTDSKQDVKTTDTDQIGFASFWQAYPKKTAKPAALLKFKSAKLKAGELDAVLIDITVRKQSDDWTKENGKYIPNPATYLNQRRWEDGETSHTKTVGGIIRGAI